MTAAEGEFVVKISPGEQPGLTYERDLMRTEALFCTLASKIAPVPEVEHTDFSRRHVDADVLVTTLLPGTPLAGRSDVDRTSIRRQLAQATRTLHTVEGEAFGYPQLGLHDTWSQAFIGMVDAVRADAERFNVTLPNIPVEQHKTLFDEIRKPVLVHFDLWDGNVLADHALTGLIDGERAFWGDPVAEFVSPALFTDIDDEFLTAYGTELTDADRVRLAAYQAYLYAIMLTEQVPRNNTDERLTRLITQALVAAVGVLG
ncbi:aminoglycoside phosphotransferase family protein [Lentzea guizhouensis]|uniref:phosphotransferase family protein n=1 Tax=Lentzea guizhouensis TaxID=1586287 RepID=UPI001F36D9B6